jgi:hypothetical protein
MKKILSTIFFFVALSAPASENKKEIITGYIALNTENDPALGEYRDDKNSFDPIIILEEYFDEKLPPETLLLSVLVWNEEHSLTTFNIGYPQSIKYLFPTRLNFDRLKTLKEGNLLDVTDASGRRFLLKATQQIKNSNISFEQALRNQVKRALHGELKIIHDTELIKDGILEPSSGSWVEVDPVVRRWERNPKGCTLTEKYRKPLEKFLENSDQQ